MQCIIKYKSNKGKETILSNHSQICLFSNRQKAKNYLRNHPFKYPGAKIVDLVEEK